ncbi:MAG TPA: alpha/beta hydrolase [Stellaceae bacterium]|nr:alpha/beta hydrolase [Stellaceae bacterium]
MSDSAGAGRLFLESGGSGSPTLLLLHGLGANATVWDGLRPILQQRWKGRWLAPDLRGHGRSFHRAPYSFGAHAADLAELCEPGEEVVVLGHSMGGAVAMTLASQWFGVQVRQVVAFGVKLVWSAEEIGKAEALARAPLRWFETRAAAIERHLRIAGLDGLVAPEAPQAAVGIVEAEGQFRLAADPRITQVVGAPIETIVAAMRAPLRLAAGERDPMVSETQMRRFDPDAVVLKGLGHNAHVEAPELLWQMVEAALG